MAFSAWLSQQWSDVKGNVKFYVGGLLLTGALTAAAALTHGLTTWQQATLVALFVISCLGVYYLVSGKANKAKQSPTAGPLVPRPAPGVPSSLPPTRLPARVSGTNFKIEIMELIFDRVHDLFLLGGGYWQILLHLRITNQDPTPATINEWELRVEIGALYDRTAQLTSLPNNWVIEREQSYNATSIEDIQQPSFDRVCADEPLTQGHSKSGWILFKLWSSDRAAMAPYNAKFTITVTDSLGGRHHGVLEPELYITRGRIKTKTETEELAARVFLDTQGRST